MNAFYSRKNKYKILSGKKIAVGYTDKFENFLAVVMVMLATIGIFRTILQAVSSF